MTGRPRRRMQEEHEPENGERWLVSYADMITVLMALFIVLFAISSVDQQKFVQLRNGLADGFGTSSTIPVPGGSGLLADAGTIPDPLRLNSPLPVPVDMAGNGSKSGVDWKPLPTPKDPADQRAADLAVAKAELAQLTAVQQQLLAALEGQHLADRVRFRITDRGLVAAIVADDVFFADASAEIEPTGLRVIDTMAPVLAQVPQLIEVEGHANHLQITGPPYPTNWHLSAARAASVVDRLVSTDGLQGARLTATGFSDTRPLYPADSPESVTGNRRVDLVIASDQPAEVRALLPALATVQGG